jgi:hypothetical protein
MPHEALSEPLRAHVRTAYSRFGQRIASISLLGGFAFDAVTLKRVDTFWENFWVVVHLALVALCILFFVTRAENRGVDLKGLAKPHFWLIGTLQFLFGGLLSTFLVFYFRSGTLRVSWPFFLILAVAFLANEKFKQGYARLNFQLSLFFLSLFCFTIFILPVVLHAIGPFMFLLSGAVSLALLYFFVRLLRSIAGVYVATGGPALLASIATIFITINVLYFLNLIPPLPLSLQDASVHHAITRTADGNYAVQSEDPGLLRFFRLTEIFHATPGAPVYAYSAVFSPTSLNTKIVHEWQVYDRKHGWTTVSRVELPVRGGRGGGYRTYSVKTGITPGVWRVNVETPTGALLGRLRFNVVLQPSDPPLITQVKN